MARRRKSFPPVPNSLPRDAQALLRALVEVSEIGDGVRGDSLDQKVTYRDLVDSGIARQVRGARPGGSGGSGLEPNQPPPDMTVPPIPRGFYAVGSFWGRIDLSWTIPSELYGNHGYTNIYRAETDNLANAALIGREVGMFYTDTLRNDTVTDDEHNKGAYYWIRFVSSAGVEGPVNDPAGTYAAPIMDLGVLLETLGGSLSESQLNQSLSERINLIDGDMPGSVNARVSEERSQRVDGQNALAQSINQVSTNLGGKVSTVEQSLQSTANALTGALESMYTVKTDVNGYVAGFGLYNDGDTSKFIVRSDVFAIAPPSGGKGGVKFPVIYDNKLGALVIDTALIRSGSIQEGQLGAISSGKIIGNDGNPITTVGGLLRADQLDANNLSVAKAATFTGTASSSNYNGTAGWRLNPNGAAVFGNGTVIVGNAEFRSGNVGDDVMIANTDSMRLIRQRAYAGSQAKDRSDQWTRPGTTNINGNQIYTGDAYVDTLQIKGQAVTIPQTYSRNGTQNSNDDRFYDFQQIGRLVINPEGGSLSLMGGAYIYNVYTGTSSYGFLRLSVNGENYDFGFAQDVENYMLAAFETGPMSGNVDVRLYIKSNRAQSVNRVFISARSFKR